MRAIDRAPTPSVWATRMPASTIRASVSPRRGPARADLAQPPEQLEARGKLEVVGWGRVGPSSRRGLTFGETAYSLRTIAYVIRNFVFKRMTDDQ